MHATREVLVSKLLTKDGRKDFDLDLLLEHANCAARLVGGGARRGVTATLLGGHCHIIGASLPHNKGVTATS